MFFILLLLLCSKQRLKQRENGLFFKKKIYNNEERVGVGCYIIDNGLKNGQLIIVLISCLLVTKLS